MPSNGSQCDVATILLGFAVFSLPLTLLVPEFSIWDYLPKTQVTRYFVFRQDVSWSYLNTIIMAQLVVFFCLYLEIRKRKLDEMVEDVLNATRATDAVMEIERGKQTATIRACVELLDASSDHYENLVLLKDDLRKRERMQQPPAIEPSVTEC